MADKTTNLTSHSLFPDTNDGFDLGDFPVSFSFAPTLVPTPTTGENTQETTDIPINSDGIEGEMEKFVGQPVTPPRTPGRDESSYSSTQSTPGSSTYSPVTKPYIEPTQNIYSPMSYSHQSSGVHQQTSAQQTNTAIQSPSVPPNAIYTPNMVPPRPINTVAPLNQTQQSPQPTSGIVSPYQPLAPPSTPVMRQKASPVRPHWFYLKHGRIWTPFSWKDSGILQQAFSAPQRSGGDRTVATDGGRYEVNIDRRTRQSIYWDEPPTMVRPCTWFCKGHDGENKLIPYEENVAEKLEEAFLAVHDDQKWPKTVNLELGDTVIMHNSNVMVHFSASAPEDEWAGEDIRSRPKVVRRGIDDFEGDIDDGEPSQIDHLVFVVHGIGPYADLKFRSLIECVNDFRKVSLEMMDGRREKLTNNQDSLVGRVEFLPVCWHSAVHHDMPSGVDRRLQSITINSVSKLREFTNCTLLDILFFTSPVYCQTIVDQVGSEMNRLLKLFQTRNPSFDGSISVCGHSLGSAILFDILQHQSDQEQIHVSKQCSSSVNKTTAENESESSPAQTAEISSDLPNRQPTLEEILQHLGLENFCLTFQMEQIDGEALMMCTDEDLKELAIPMGPRKKILSFQKEYTRIQACGEGFKGIIKNTTSEKHTEKQNNEKKEELINVNNPSCQSSFSTLSHNPSTIEVVEMVQYHHGVEGTAGTGQPYVRYPKLNFQPCNMFALGSPIGLFLTVRGVENIGEEYTFPSCPGFYNIFHPYDPVAYRLEPLIINGFQTEPVLMPHHKGRKRMHLELRENLSRLGANLRQKLVEGVKETWATINDFARAHTTSNTDQSSDKVNTSKDFSDNESQSDVDEKHETAKIVVGTLNRGQRVDYVLQEKPIEILNEYLFALSSHLCYWQSEDTALFMLKEIYKNS